MKFHFDVRLLIHATMLAFAGASLGNVYIFFSTAGHPGGVAWALAIALGSALVILSIMLTHVDRETSPTAFGWLLATALLLGAISGALQMSVYQYHLPLSWAILLGFGIPLGGEVCLAFATSAYLKARDGERFKNMSGAIETAVVDHLEEALDSFDAEQMAGSVEETVNRLTRIAMDSVAAKALSYYRTDSISPDDEEQEDRQFGPQNLPLAQAGRDEAAKVNIAAKKQAILDMLDTEGAQNVTGIANSINVHRQSARKYLDDLASESRVELKNRKWQIVSIPSDTL
ncbi:MAG: hypothetical protein AAF702_38105 [Chloroflexota bacterium]